MEEKTIDIDGNYKNKIYEIKNICLCDKIEIKNLEIIKTMHNGYILFSNCKFTNKIEIAFDNYFDVQKTKLNVETLHFEDCVFEDDVVLTKESIGFEFIFNNCIFLKDLILKKTVFENYCDFSRSKFLGKIDLEFTTFDDKCSFKDVTFNSEYKFDLRETYVNDKIDFLGICSKEISGIKIKSNDFFQIIKEINEIKQEDNLSVSNRETARIIKDSFEQQNNIIEANKFYALEMKEREKELERDLKEGKNLFEWLVFKIHGLSSNHSQDWVLSLFWILSFSFGYSFMSFVNKLLDTKLEYILTDAFIYIFVIYTSILIINYKKINKFYLTGLFYILYIYLSKDFTLQTFSNNLNPFSIMTEFSELNFSTMIYKIIIAYLIYQLIISIRQNTRRK